MCPQELGRLCQLSVSSEASPQQFEPIIRCVQLVREVDTAGVRPLRSPLELYAAPPYAVAEEELLSGLAEDGTYNPAVAWDEPDLEVSFEHLRAMAGEERVEGLFVTVPKVLAD